MVSTAALPSGCRLANDYRVGSWVVWARPDVPVSIDGRNDLFGTDLGQLGWFESATRIPDTMRELADLGVSCVLARVDSPLPPALHPPRIAGAMPSSTN